MIYTSIKSPKYPNSGYSFDTRLENPILAKGIAIIQKIADINIWFILNIEVILLTHPKPLDIAVVNIASHNIIEYMYPLQPPKRSAILAIGISTLYTSV